MKLDNLLEQVEKFYKAAGLLNIPDEWTKDIPNYFLNRYIVDILNQVSQNSFADEKEKKQFISTCTNIIAKTKTNPIAWDGDNAIFELPFKNNIMEVQAKYWARQFPRDDDEFEAYFFPISPSEDDFVMGRIEVIVSIPNDIKEIFSSQDKIAELNKKANYLIMATHHELRHAMQFYIQFTNGLREPAGLPSKKIRDPKYEPMGKEIGIPKGQSKNKLPHALQDIEFYTRLSDEVYTFKQEVQKIPAPLQRVFLIAWLDNIPKEDFEAQLKEVNKDENISTVSLPRIYFQKLKKHQFGKYQKAVKEFIKAVS